MATKRKTSHPRTALVISFCMLVAIMAGTFSPPDTAAKGKNQFTGSFMTDQCNGFSSSGTNPFFVLEPGFTLVLEGREKRDVIHLTITVLDEITIVDGIATRVVEERETRNDLLAEVSRNYFAICNRTNSVFYFGEDVDIYDDTGTTIVSHDGSWLAGVNEARAGIVMPGTVLLGARYFQEVAPGVAMDRAEILSLSAVVETPAGTFSDCLLTRETTPLDRRAKDFKFYAPGIGLVKDGVLLLKQLP